MHETGLRLAELARGRCELDGPGTGACVMSSNRTVFSLGWASYPQGVECPKTREYRIHAEVNAILHAACSVRGWTMYVTSPPCLNCAVVLIQARIALIVTRRSRAPLSQYWTETCEDAAELLGDRLVFVP